MFMLRKNYTALRGYFMKYVGLLYIQSGRIYQTYITHISDSSSTIRLFVCKSCMLMQDSNGTIEYISKISHMFDKLKDIYRFICMVSKYEQEILYKQKLIKKLYVDFTTLFDHRNC